MTGEGAITSSKGGFRLQRGASMSIKQARSRHDCDPEVLHKCFMKQLRAYAKTGLECPPLEDLSSLINPGGDHHDRAVHRQFRPQERCILCPETSERPLNSDRHTAAILLDARNRLRIFPLRTYVKGFS